MPPAQTVASTDSPIKQLKFNIIFTADCAKTHIVLLRLLDKKGLAVVSELHMQLHRFPIDLYVDLQGQTTRYCETRAHWVTVFSSVGLSGLSANEVCLQLYTMQLIDKK